MKNTVIYNNPSVVTVTKEATYLEDGTRTGQYALVNHDNKVLPCKSVSDSYEVVQYSTIVDNIINPLFEQGWNVKKAKAYRNGMNAVWVLENDKIPLPEGIKAPNGIDKIKWSLMARAGHGAVPIVFDVFGGRLICLNGARVTIRGTEFGAKFWHRSNVHTHLLNFGSLMKKFEETVKAWSQRAEHMVGHVLRNEEVTELYNKFYPVPEKKKSRVQGIHAYMQHVRREEASELGYHENDAWLVYNSLTNAQQHMSSSKQGKMERFVVGSVASQGEAAFNAVEALVLA
jgi:hypothetical protein